MTVMHRQDLLSIPSLRRRTVDCQKLLSTFTNKYHIQLSDGLCPRDYRRQMENRLRQELHSLPQVGLSFKIKALEILKRINCEQDKKILEGDYAVDLVFKYDPLIRYLIDLKVGGEQLSKEHIYEYVQYKILQRLKGGFYLSRYRGGDLRCFLDQEIEYRILDGIRREQKSLSCVNSETELIERTSAQAEGLEDSLLFKQLVRQFAVFSKTLKREERQELFLQLLICHASQEHLALIFQLFPNNPEAVSLFFAKVDELYLSSSKQAQYELIAWFLTEVGRPRQPDTIRKQLEKHKRNIWQILFKQSLDKEKAVEKDRIDVFDWVIDAFFTKRL